MYKKYKKQNEETIELGKILNIDNIEDKLFYNTYSGDTKKKIKYDIKRADLKNQRTCFSYFEYDINHGNGLEISSCLYNKFYNENIALVYDQNIDYNVPKNRLKEFLKEYKNTVVKNSRELFHKYYPTDNNNNVKIKIVKFGDSK